MTRLPLKDMNYFGTSWPVIQEDALNGAFALGGGYANPRVMLGGDNKFFAGTLEKLNGAGQVTDVVLSFAATQEGYDLPIDVSLLLGGTHPEADRAAAIYDSLLAAPRYANAAIHVTGHSMGGALTSYVLGHSLVKYGATATDARADFTQFGAPPWGQSIANHFGLGVGAFDGHIIGYAVENDVVQAAGTSHLGVRHLMALYEPFGPLGGALNGVAAHHSTAYLGGLGLPDWLTSAQKTAIIAAVRADSGAVDLYDPNYGATGPVAQKIFGDSAANTLTGTARADQISGGAGGDTLTGGAGGDRFVYSAGQDATFSTPDYITDFNRGQDDRIDLAGVDANTGVTGNQAFTFVGAAAAPLAGQLRIQAVGDKTWVLGNTDADADYEVAILVKAQNTPVAADFVL